MLVVGTMGFFGLLSLSDLNGGKRRGGWLGIKDSRAHLAHSYRQLAEQLLIPRPDEDSHLIPHFDEVFQDCSTKEPGRAEEEDRQVP